jgi:hypothetical protein
MRATSKKPQAQSQGPSQADRDIDAARRVFEIEARGLLPRLRPPGRQRFSSTPVKQATAISV